MQKSTNKFEKYMIAIFFDLINFASKIVFINKRCMLFFMV